SHVRAERVLAALAPATLSARIVQAAGDAFALLQPRRLGHDFTGHLMPQDQGRPDGIDGPADDLQISATQAHRADADHHVVGGYLWRFRNVSDLEWLTKRGQNRGFHTITLPPATSRVMPVTQLAASDPMPREPPVTTATLSARSG